MRFEDPYTTLSSLFCLHNSSKPFCSYVTLLLLAKKKIISNSQKDAINDPHYFPLKKKKVHKRPDISPERKIL